MPQPLLQYFTHYRIVLFDAQCVLCQGWTKFLIRHDRHAKFKLVSVQSPVGQQLLTQHGFCTTQFDTMVLIDHGKVSTQSTAFLNIMQQLGFPWQILSLGKLSPKICRDPLYSLIAKNRYQWFGKTGNCLMPHPELKQHFLESYLHV